ncbi:MAG: hypothetical protein KAJ32_10520, partial [Gammaproteobacteria bacterium]|nr:hypothetical protein [Gammaproteobacteria bacterium]
RYRFDIGARTARDSFVNGEDKRSDQLTLGASTRLFDNRLSLHLRRDQSLSNNANADFPTRTSIGADYRLTQSLSLFVEQEFSEGDDIKSQNTRAGLNASPWTGGNINASMSREFDENGERVYANTGLNQRWTLNERWSIDASIDRSEIMKDNSTPFNVNVPPTSGSAGNDFTAVSTGVNYRRDTWNWNTRIEQRIADTEHKKGIYSGIAGEVNEGLGMSLRLQLFDTDRNTGEQHRASELRYALAYRPLNSRWIVLNRSDYDVETQSGGTVEFDNWKLINNTNANYKKKGMQLDLHYGAKYVKGTFDTLSYSGYTDLIGMEYRRDLSKYWDLGAHANVLNSRQLHQILYSYGLSLGVNLAENMWISFGYNWDGFEDNDFSTAGYTADGPYVKLRFKFDQRTVRDAVDWFNRQ